ncbi:hypothetical protein BKA93DRAFT_164057 [Sparassis latifolia]
MLTLSRYVGPQYGSQGVIPDSRRFYSSVTKNFEMLCASSERSSSRNLNATSNLRRQVEFAQPHTSALPSGVDVEKGVNMNALHPNKFLVQDARQGPNAMSGTVWSEASQAETTGADSHARAGPGIASVPGFVVFKAARALTGTRCGPSCCESQGAHTRSIPIMKTLTSTPSSSITSYS